MSTYSVEGRIFANGALAEAYAQLLATKTGRPVVVMESVDFLPPHVIYTAKPAP